MSNERLHPQSKFGLLFRFCFRLIKIDVKSVIYRRRNIEDSLVCHVLIRIGKAFVQLCLFTDPIKPIELKFGLQKDIDASILDKPYLLNVFIMFALNNKFGGIWIFLQVVAIGKDGLSSSQRDQSN